MGAKKSSCGVSELSGSLVFGPGARGVHQRLIRASSAQPVKGCWATLPFLSSSSRTLVASASVVNSAAAPASPASPSCGGLPSSPPEPFAPFPASFVVLSGKVYSDLPASFLPPWV
nr:unnamed protein product [Digitaria exilis]